MNKRQKAYKKGRNIYRNNTSRMDKLFNNIMVNSSRELTFAILNKRLGVGLTEGEEDTIQRYLSMQVNKK